MSPRYNSVLFTVTAVSDCTGFLVGENFLTSNLWNTSELEPDPTLETLIGQSQSKTGGLTRLEPSDCIKGYNATIASSWGNVLLVTNSTPINDTSYNVYSYSYTEGSPLGLFCSSSSNSPVTNSVFEDVSPDGYYYQLCCNSSQLTANYLLLGSSCTYPDSAIDEDVASSSNSSTLDLELTVQYCLAQPQQHCKLIVIPFILWIVVMCVIVKVFCLLCLLLLPDFQPLLTVGDSISSFLKDPDLWTNQHGPISTRDIHNFVKHEADGQISCLTTDFPLRPWRTHSSCWFRGASQQRWIGAGTV